MRAISLEPIIHHNPFLMEPERRLAHRAELKRKIAELQVKQSRFEENEGIVAKLQADSDKAAEEHSEAASKLQIELDGLDSLHIDAIVRGENAPEQLLERRGQILKELGDLNQKLELRCEANRRAIQSTRKQGEGLRAEFAQIQVTENKLRQLCSPETRQQMLAAEFTTQGFRIAIADVRRREEIQRHNVTLHKRNKDEGSSDAVISAARLADLEAAGRILDRSLSAAVSEHQRLLEVSLTE